METRIVYEAYPKTPVDEFVTDLEYEFSDAPHDLLVHNVLRVVASMCEQSNILRRTALVRTQAGVPNYTFEAPDNMQVIALLSICPVGGAHATAPIVRLTTAPQAICHAPMNSVWVENKELIFSAPGNRDTFRVEMSVKPTYQTCELDTCLLTDYYETLCLGVRSLMFDMADKPWSSLQRAALARQEFYRACSDNAVRAMTRNQRGAFRVRRPRAF